MASESALILFTLSPEVEGRRKSLGLGRPERAAAVFSALLHHLEEVCGGLRGVDLLIATPHRDRSLPKGTGKYLPQRGRSFGESLELAVDDAFSLGYRRVVVIGNDAPEISRKYLEDAFETLTAFGPRAAVLGPARDGGYALLGLTMHCPEAFQAMPWGTSRVARLTEARLAAHGFAVERLATLEDIDHPRSLARFLARARTGLLSDVAVRITALLSPASVTDRPQPRKGGEIFLTGWLSLRAPPLPA